MRDIFSVALLVFTVVCSSSVHAPILACAKYCEYIQSIGSAQELPVYRCDCWYRHQHARDRYGDIVQVIPKPAVEALPPLTGQLTFDHFSSPWDVTSRQNVYPRFAKSDVADTPVSFAEFLTTKSTTSKERPKPFKAVRKEVKAFRRNSDLSGAMRLLTINQTTTAEPTEG